MTTHAKYSVWSFINIIIILSISEQLYADAYKHAVSYALFAFCLTAVVSFSEHVFLRIARFVLNKPFYDSPNEIHDNKEDSKPHANCCQIQTEECSNEMINHNRKLLSRRELPSKQTL
jgi:hypothetical protein